MKFTVTALAATLISVVSAKITLIEPWGQSVWNADGTGLVKWNSTKEDATKQCAIHFLKGEGADITLVSNFTQNGLVPCNYTEAHLTPLPDYESGKYFVRFGPNDESTDNWGYSGYFSFLNREDTAKAAASVETSSLAPEVSSA